MNVLSSFYLKFYKNSVSPQNVLPLASCLLPLASCLFPAPYSLLPTPS
ncbi:MAG: hypothetical protein F6K55_36670 [Moorea sp. SIO4A3]|nr:hypothetical protein [Moorena sp. SIO4A3]